MSNGSYNYMPQHYGIPYDVVDYPNTKWLYHNDKLYRLLFTLFKINDLPDNWDGDYIKSGIFCYGYMGFFKNTISGALPVWCGIESYDYKYRPSKLMYSNWALGDNSARIGKDCEIVYANYQLMPLLGIVNYYAQILANIDGSLTTNIYNTRLAHVFYANNEATKQAIQVMFDAISAGNPAVIVTPKIMDAIRNGIVDFNNVANTFIGDKLNELYRSVLNRFLSDIGIPNTPYEKRERLISNEVNSNNSEVQGVLSNTIDTLNTCFKRVNKMFGTSINVSSNLMDIGGIINDMVSNDFTSYARDA